MNASPQPSRTVPALVTGVATTLYYASPDVVRSRVARGWLKAGLTAVTFAASLPDLRAARTDARACSGHDGAPDLLDVLATMPVGRQVAGIGAVGALLATTVRVLIAGERWIFRRGEARAAAGKRLPHTRAALVLGALGAVLTLVPAPRGTSGAGEPARR